MEVLYNNIKIIVIHMYVQMKDPFMHHHIWCPIQ
jgi:hypothetical protein